MEIGHKKLSVDPKFSIFCCGGFSKIEFFLKKNRFFRKKSIFQKSAKTPQNGCFATF
jgi:hypothetical protein